MAQTILVIDSNPAVQAIASLALSHLGVEVETLSSGKSALDTVRHLHPDLVICSSETDDLDVFSFCREIKDDSDLCETGFLLMVPGKTADSLAEDSNAAGVDEVLPKPFKSEQLRNVVQDMLFKKAEAVGEEDSQASALLLINDPIIEKILQKYLRHRKTSCQFASSEDELGAINGAVYEATFITASAVANTSWFNAKQMGKLVIITEDGKSPSNTKPGKNIELVNRPLSEDALDSVLEGVLPELEAEARSTALSQSDQALLAARISASVYERLLVQGALRSRDWQNAGDQIRNEMLKVLEEFDLASED